MKWLATNFRVDCCLDLADGCSDRRRQIISPPLAYLGRDSLVVGEVFGFALHVAFPDRPLALRARLKHRWHPRLNDRRRADCPGCQSGKKVTHALPKAR